MLDLKVDEGYAFDYLSILHVKNKKINSEKTSILYTSCHINLEKQINDNKLWNKIISSEEYIKLIYSNLKTFNAVEQARYGTITAKEVDDLNMERFYAKKQLQDKFFLNDVLFYVLLGVFTASVSIYFSKVYSRIGAFFRDFRGAHRRLLVGGILLGIMVFIIPPLFGEGYSTINNLLKGNVEPIISNNIFHVEVDNILVIITFLLGLILFKVIATALTFGAGGVGGVFAPTLFTGSVTGYVFALIINHSNLFSHQLSSTNFAMVGMAGLMAGILQAPLTAIFLIAEITGGYELFVPLMIVSSISFLISKHYVPHNIYASELAKKGHLLTHNKDKNVLMLMDIDKVIETNFIILHPEMNLGDIVQKAVIKSSRNHFPVVNDDNEFLGILMLDDIRSIMFEQDLYQKLKARSLMQLPPQSTAEYDLNHGVVH